MVRRAGVAGRSGRFLRLFKLMRRGLSCEARVGESRVVGVGGASWEGCRTWMLTQGVADAL